MLYIQTQRMAQIIAAKSGYNASLRSFQATEVRVHNRGNYYFNIAAEVQTHLFEHEMSDVINSTI